MTWAGTVLVLFAGWSLWGTGLGTARAQDRLTDEFERSLTVAPNPRRPPVVADAPPDATAAEPSPTTTEPPFTPLDEDAPSPPAGAAVALLKIPKIGVQQAVVEGVDARSLAQGPGHYPGTPMPGEPGNAAIAGHRTTYGAPFFHFEKLRVGDLILVTTRASGVLRYRVTDTKVVRATDRTVLVPKGDDRLTLTTCHPAYRATERLVITAHQEGAPPVIAVAAAAEAAAREAEAARLRAIAEDPAFLLGADQVPDFSTFARPAPVADAALDAPEAPAMLEDADEAGRLLPAAGWSAAAAMTWAAMLAFGRGGRRRWAARLVGAPVLVMSLIGAFDALGTTLPGSL